VASTATAPVEVVPSTVAPSKPEFAIPALPSGYKHVFTDPKVVGIRICYTKAGASDVLVHTRVNHIGDDGKETPVDTFESYNVYVKRIEADRQRRQWLDKQEAINKRLNEYGAASIAHATFKSIEEFDNWEGTLTPIARAVLTASGEGFRAYFGLDASTELSETEASSRRAEAQRIFPLIRWGGRVFDSSKTATAVPEGSSVGSKPVYKQVGITRDEAIELLAKGKSENWSDEDEVSDWKAAERPIYGLVFTIRRRWFMYFDAEYQSYVKGILPSWEELSDTSDRGAGGSSNPTDLQ